MILTCFLVVFMAFGLFHVCLYHVFSLVFEWLLNGC